MLAIICALLATVLKIRSCLFEHSGTLAAVAVLLANNPKLEQMIAGKSTQSELEFLFAGSLVRAGQDNQGHVSIDVTLLETELSSGRTPPSAAGFRSTTLHWLYISSIATLGLMFLVAISATLHGAVEGLTVSGWTAQDAWSFMPTM